MEPPPPPLTSDAVPVKSKVAASQGVDYCSTPSTVKPYDHQQRDRCRFGAPYERRYPVSRNHARVPLHMFPKMYPENWPP